jgi:transcriptional regulator with XRE-family HTH domain
MLFVLAFILPPLYYFCMGSIKSFTKIDSFGERLKLVRLCFQITQSELADLIGNTQGTLTKIERNVFIPEEDVIEQLNNLFFLNPLYLRFGEAPIFTKRMIFGDFLVADRNRKLQNLFSGELIKKIFLYFLSKEKVHEAYMISGKPLYTAFIFVSDLNFYHFLFFRTDIEAGNSIKETLVEQKIKTHSIESADLLGALNSIYASSTNNDFDLIKKRLVDINIPQKIPFLLELVKEEMLSPLLITETAIKKDTVQKLLDCFVANKANENEIRAAVKWLKEMRKSEK